MSVRWGVESEFASELGICEEVLPSVGVEVSALVGVEWADGGVRGVFVCKLVVFPAEVEELGTVSKAKVGGGGVACCVECEVKDVEVNEAEEDVGG